MRSRPEYDVIVIGAGMSGISAASEMDKKGLRVLVLEARDRIGGRINTMYPFGQDNVAVELGAQWIHGTEANLNPLLHLIDNVSLPSDWEHTKMFNKHGALVDPKVASKCLEAVEQLGERCVEAYKKGGRGSFAAFMARDVEWSGKCIFGTCPPGKVLVCANCVEKVFVGREFENVEGAELDELSIGEKAGEGNFEGDNVIPVKGYRWLLEKLIREMRSTEFRFGCEVQSIDYSGEFVTIFTSRGIYHAKTIVSTIPLGVMKSPHAPKFTPPLPPAYQHSIKTLGFGLLDKTILTFEKSFWPPSTHGFQSHLDLSPHGGPSDAFILLFNLKAGIQYNGDPNIIVAYYAANVADWLETLPDEKVVPIFLNHLTHLFGAPTPLLSHTVTRWRNEKYSCGSYSYLSKGSEFSDQAVWTRPVGGGKVVFAGEHTIETHFATVHGALLSGRRAAEQVLKKVEGVDEDFEKKEKGFGEGSEEEKEEEEDLVKGNWKTFVVMGVVVLIVLVVYMTF